MSTETTNVKKAPEPKKVNVNDVVALLKSGYTRYKKEDKGYGSIQEKYNLTGAECRTLFAHDSIKNIKVKIPTLLIIEGDAPKAPEAPVKPAEEMKPAFEGPKVGFTPAPAPVAATTPDPEEGLFS